MSEAPLDGRSSSASGPSDGGIPRRDDRERDRGDREEERGARADSRPARKRRAPTQWDVLPEGYVEGSGLGAVMTTAAPPSASSVAGLGVSGAASQQTRHARRLYVGGVGDAPEKEIEEYFAGLVRTAALRPVAGNPILSVYLNPERKFAFVEFNSIELANAFVELDGLIFKGHPVKIRRPDDYNAANLPVDLRDRKEALDTALLPLSQQPGGAFRAGGVGGPGGLHRVYIGQIPPALGEAQLMELASAFGAVRKLDVLHNADGSAKGYAFLEYADPAVTDTAIAALNGLNVGDRSLSVSRAKAAEGGGGAVATAAGGFGAAAGPVPSRIVLLERMVLPEELAADGTFREIVEEISGECGKYGRLLTVQVPRPPAPDAGRVYLVYEDVAGSVAALTALHGRQFSGRTIQATFLDEASFAS